MIGPLPRQNKLKFISQSRFCHYLPEFRANSEFPANARLLGPEAEHVTGTEGEIKKALKEKRAGKSRYSIEITYFHRIIRIYYSR